MRARVSLFLVAGAVLLFTICAAGQTPAVAGSPDPVLDFATLSSDFYDTPPSVAEDSVKATYVLSHPRFQPLATVTKYDRYGRVVYTTNLGSTTGGNFYDRAIAVDSTGAAYIAGSTDSATFPATAGAFQTALSGTLAAVVVKLKPDGTVAYATFLGGTDNASEAYGIAVDSDGAAVVTGYTSSTTFPLLNAARSANQGGGDAFVAKLNPTGSALVFSTYLGGSGSDRGLAVAADAGKASYVTGFTASTGFPVINALQTTTGGGIDAFVAKLDANGALLYSTYLGGAGDDQGNAIAVDSSGAAYVAGSTQSTDFPVMNAFQAVNPVTGCTNPVPCDKSVWFISKIAAGGGALDYSTYHGPLPSGSTTLAYNGSAARSMALDSSATAYIAGSWFDAYLGHGVYGSRSILDVVDVNGALLNTYTIFPAPSAIDMIYSFSDDATGVALDPDGSAAIVGTTAVSGLGTNRVYALKWAFSGSNQLTLTPAKVTFADQSVGTTSAAQTVTVSNTGTVAITLGLGSSGDFQIAGGTCSSGLLLLPADSCTITTTFTPSVAGTRSGTLTVSETWQSFVSSTAFPPPGPFTAALAGNGITPTVALNVAALDFGSVNVGNSSTAQTITVNNSGPGGLAVKSISVSPDYAQTNTCLSDLVAAGASCTVTITFSPTVIGSRNGVLTIYDNAPDSPQTASLTGIGSGPVAVPSPNPMAFPNTISGSSSTQTLTLTNVGTAGVTVTGATVSGTNASEFAISNKCTASIAPTATCAIDVTFSPGAIGPRVASLTITTSGGNAPAGAGMSITSLSGTGTDFSLMPSGGQTSISVSKGQAAIYHLSVSPAPGFTGNVSFTCSGAPPQGACTVNPATATVGASTVTVDVTVTTTAPTRTQPVIVSGIALPGPGDGGTWLLIGALGLLLLTWVRRKTRVALGGALRLLLLAVLFMTAWTGCGGGSSSTPAVSNPGTPSGTYTITVSATSAGATRTTNFTLVVN